MVLSIYANYAQKSVFLWLFINNSIIYIDNINNFHAESKQHMNDFFHYVSFVTWILFVSITYMRCIFQKPKLTQW